ncbi:non-ribosomal peptide synthetase [Mycobacteroides abscessus]|uniref:non-ribosomal peptide synthetase n=1 Tax=Mycobacteroides abscessus TaxID=36809 RepID=UPI0002587DF6|nr:non-ribosomal peptide synthetase [Mycobacteroides abscessus]EIC67541.1 amino acid adenylation domain-containing protein [Mycobacteroides abscessus M93]
MTEAAELAYGVSPVQRYRWSRKSDGAPESYAQLTATLHGSIDPDRLGEAVAAVVARHEALRTSFTGLADETPVQLIGEPDRRPVRVADLMYTTVAELCEAERAGLDPLAGQVFRAAVGASQVDPWVLVLTVHGLAGDRQSLRIVLAEIVAAYGADGSALEPDGPMQYADFAAWHDEILVSEDAASERAAWADELGGGLPLEPPARPAGQAPGWQWSRTQLAPELAARLAQSGQREALLSTLFQVLVWRTGGERDIVTGRIESGRGFENVRHAVGPFERTVPVVARLTAQSALADLVADNARRDAERRERIDYLDPFAVRDTAGQLATPFFAFEVYEAPAPAVSPEVSMLASDEIATTDAAFRFGCEFSGDQLTITAGIDRARADAALPATFTGHFITLLAAALDNPASPIGELAVMSADERELTAQRGYGPAVDYSSKPIHEVIAGQAQRTPDAVAVTERGAVTTYADLDARAGAIAGRLQELGVQPGDRVVVSMGRSSSLVAALLGVLKSGAAFVPVDVAYPAARLEFVLTETAAPVLLAGSEIASRINQSAATVVTADDIADNGGSYTAVPSGPSDLAYVLYTSGTTGVPNGVEVTHRGLGNYLHWSADAYRLSEGSGAIAHSSIGFDFTLTTLLGPLLVGQQVIVIPEAEGITGLVAALRSHTDLSVVKLTPTHLDVVNQLLEHHEFAGRVRTLVMGGEALRAESLAQFRGAGTTIVNEYGPTETVVGSVAYVVDADTPSRGPVPIGTPIANTAVHLLDPRGHLVPDGAIGEIHIGGSGLARGYLARPELTEHRFWQSPVTGERLYRTGDLARRHTDGTLEYLGRGDDQVKIRGVRIEPAEIENVLRRHPTIGTQGSVVVIARSDDDPGESSPLAGNVMLVAYLVPVPGASPAGSGEYAEHCRTYLPDLFVPSAFVALDSLPVNVNGKLDRSALPRPVRRAAAAGDYVAPGTPTEEILAGAVATVLGLERVSVADNYFALGGDSIRSVMIASRVQARGVGVTVADLHRFPTIRECAAHMDTDADEVADVHSEPFSLISEEDRAQLPAEVDDAFPLNLLQEGMIFHRDFAAKSAVYHAIASVRLRAPLDLDVMRMVVRQLLERHPMLRTSFEMSTYSVPLQLVHGEFDTPLHSEDLRGAAPAEQDAEVERWVAYEKEIGFELHDYPLIRFKVHILTDETFQFTYGFHHEIVDGWSEALMIAEIFSHYFSIIFDEPVSIRPPTSTMRDAVALEQVALEDKRNYEFWDEYLADATLMRLPRKDGGPRADKGDRDIVRIVVPVTHELSAQLEKLAAAQAVPLKSVLMAAHVAVMSAYGGHTDTLTYTVANGRPEAADGSTAIGLFVNSLALRVRMNGGSWQDLIHATLESERASLPFRRLPMAELKRHQGNEPLSEALFFFTNYHVFDVLNRWKNRGVEHVANELYGESTFPFCGIFRLNRDEGLLEVRIEYDSLQFSAELADGIRDCYVQVLQAMVADANARYDATPIRCARDRALTEALTAGPVTGVPGDCLHHLIEQQAAQRPDAAVVQLDETVLSYGELNKRANQLAHLLRAHGIGPERTVGVLAERSVELIVALVAVLKAGGAYLPLDPGQPDERLAALISTGAATVVLTQPHLRSRVPSGPATIEVDPAISVAAQQPSTSVQTAVVPANAAYVIFTSGSTGAPKGVVVTHANVVASLAARPVMYGERMDRFLLLSSYAFDSSVAGIFWALTAGGTLIVPREGIQIEPAGLVETIARQRPTHTLGIPSLLASLVDQAGPTDLASLQLVIAAGEACPAAVLDATRAAVPGVRFANEYGPTEATVWATAWLGAPHTGAEIDGAAADPSSQPNLPIGAPVANTRAEILNPYGHPVPVGVSAELYLGGAGIARGYLDRPADTAASFLPDPHAAGARRYASGDLGRYASDGQLEFLGRADFQVKIRGFRVEPAEIEAVLETHAGLQRAIVVVRGDGDGDGDKILVAYVLPVAGQRSDTAELQQYVRDRLPKYMVPTACVILDALPLTATGKVDRVALPTPTAADLTRGTEYQPPQTETEQALAAIWAKVLKLDRVGVNDRFFDIGGESLRAMQVTTATTRMFGVKLAVRQLFEAATVAEFARVVDDARLAVTAGGHLAVADRV